MKLILIFLYQKETIINWLYIILQNASVEKKTGDANFCTEYDVKVQKFLIDELSKILPEASFFGEEETSNNIKDLSREYTFYIDPIDGTTNFVKDYHYSAISVALLNGKDVVAGVVYNPYLDEAFYAIKGQGAFCNGKKISVSSQPLDKALVLFGSSPYDKDLFPKTIEVLSEYFYKKKVFF